VNPSAAEAGVLTFIYALVIAAGVLFLVGAANRVFRKQEGTMYWRGAMGLLGFAVALLLLELYKLALEGAPVLR
jgi:hypothetical protein